MISPDNNKIIFENTDYKNPNKAIYELLPSKYNREISGIEKDKPTSYKFIFESQIKE